MLRRLSNLNLFLILLLAVSVLVLCVADANNALTANGTISAQAVEAGGNYITINISNFFTDSDGEWQYNSDCYLDLFFVHINPIL